MRRRAPGAVTSGDCAIPRTDRTTLIRRMDRAIGGCCCDQPPAPDDRGHEARDQQSQPRHGGRDRARLIAEVEARGMKLFTTIDHSAEARATGLELRETKLVVFGN